MITRASMGRCVDSVSPAQSFFLVRSCLVQCRVNLEIWELGEGSTYHCDCTAHQLRPLNNFTLARRSEMREIWLGLD
jgi:hypothetical protein